MFCIRYETMKGTVRTEHVKPENAQQRALMLAALHGVAFVWGEKDPDDCRKRIGIAESDYPRNAAGYFPTPPEHQIFWCDREREPQEE